MSHRSGVGHLVLEFTVGVKRRGQCAFVNTVTVSIDFFYFQRMPVELDVQCCVYYSNVRSIRSCFSVGAEDLIRYSVRIIYAGLVGQDLADGFLHYLDGD